MSEQVQHAIERACGYLCAAQLPSGKWTDFWLSVGTSDTWVTAFVALAIADVCREAAMKAAHWLATQRSDDGGFRYNSASATDADSTAFAVSLFAKLDVPIPSEALRFLWDHYIPGGGFATYSFRDSSHAWTHAGADVTASVLLALFAARALDRPRLAQHFMELLHPAQRPSGDWDGFWWEEPAYTTALTLEIWNLVGSPSLLFPLSPKQSDNAFSTACRLLIAVHTRNAIEARRLAAELSSRQQPDGAWPGDARLRVPPSHPQRNVLQAAEISHDQRRVFTTALAIRALCAASSLLADVDAVMVPSRGLQRSWQGLAADRLIDCVSTELGFSDAASVFHCLTSASLDERTVWPAPQLSSLSGGAPFEFSINVSDSKLPSLRYTVEPGDVQAPPAQRVRSAVATAEALVHLLDYGASWQRFLPAIQLLQTSLESVAQWQRFLIWIGVDYQSPGEPPVLKIYFCLRPGVELAEVLRAADFPLAPQSAAVLRLLSEHGFAQEIAFGLAPGQKCGVKIYWELAGWRRSLVERTLDLAEFPGDTDSLCPEIPGLLRESLAVKSRAGVALGIHAKTGEITTVTTAAALIPGLLSSSTVAARLQEWIRTAGWSGVPHQRLFTALARFGSPCHTLFTRSLSRAGKRTAAIYLRPAQVLPFSRSPPRKL